MRCDRVIEELHLCFGQELPRDLRRHLSGCDECRSVWSELADIATTMPEDEAFFLSTDEIAEAVASVESQVKSLPAMAGPSITNRLQEWFGSILGPRPVPAAVGMAAVAVLVVAWMGAYAPTSIAEKDLAVQEVEQELLSTEYSAIEEEYVQPTQETFEALVQEFTYGSSAASTDDLLDDLTDDEYEYLLESIAVEDLL